MSVICDQLKAKPKTLKEKVKVIVDTLRNNNGISQCYYNYTDYEDKLCAVGLLAFRAGIPIGDLRNGYMIDKIFKQYDVTLRESLECFIEFNDSPRLSLIMIPKLNDLYRLSFDEMADLIEKSLPNLK